MYSFNSQDTNPISYLKEIDIESSQLMQCRCRTLNLDNLIRPPNETNLGGAEVVFPLNLEKKN